MLYGRSPRHLIVVVQALPDKYRRLLPDVPRYHKEGLDRVVLNQKFIDVIVNASASAFQSNASVSGPGQRIRAPRSSHWMPPQCRCRPRQGRRRHACKLCRLPSPALPCMRMVTYS